MGFRRSTVALGIALTLPLSAAAAVEPMQTFAAEYSVTFYGLPVARSTIVSSVGANRYLIKGTIESAGLASFFRNTKGQTMASGHYDQTGIKPDTYEVTYVYGSKSKRTGLRFAKGNIVKVSNTPALPKRGPDWVPVRSIDLRAVFDPLSAVLVPAKDASSVCGRTLKAFDGEIRANLILSYVGTGQDSIGGQQREVVTCAARFQPIAGYRPANKSLQFLSTQSRIVMKFAELGQTGIYAPVQASVSTKVGTFSIRARQLEAVQ
jgi:Protein of unknown function (DUF3108)